MYKLKSFGQTKMAAIRLNSHRTKVFALLLLCYVAVWVVYTRLYPHVEIFTHHTGFNLLADIPTFHRPRLRDVYQPEFRDPRPSLCPSHGVNLDLLILATSSPSNYHQRMAVRHTWGQYHRRRKISIGFMIGVHYDPQLAQNITEENSEHSDIILNNNIDSYFNLTLKTASIFEWITTYCPKAKRVLKCDDDMFVNIPRLMDLIQKLPEQGSYIYGRLRENVRPERYRFSKYFLSERLYGPHVYPTFTTGGAYLTTPAVTLRIYKAGMNFTFLPLEDVFHTGVVAQQVGVTRVSVPEITNMEYVFWRNACLVHKAITFHTQSLEEMYRLWGYSLNRRRWCVTGRTDV